MILNQIEERYNNLSKQHRKIASYILENYVDVAFMGIIELSNRSGVSTATITRFVKQFGYKSFSEFQKALESLAKIEITPVKEYQSYVLEHPKKNVLTDQIDDAKTALDAIYSDQLNEEISKIAHILAQAHLIYVLGSRSSFSIAYYTYFSLKRVKENIRLIENRNEDTSIELQYITDKDVLLVISYPKYTQFTVDVVRYFKKRGCVIISITDRLTSPIAKAATHLLIVKNKLKIYFITTIAVINALLVMMGQINPDLNIATFQEENEVTDQLGVYIKDKTQKTRL